MGLMRLDDFREEVVANLGDRGLTNRRVDSWVNFAYRELCGALEFEELRFEQKTTTVPGVRLYEFPEKFLGIVAVADVTNKRRLERLDAADLLLKDKTITGPPTHWGRRAKALVLWPVPDGQYELNAIFFREPDLLVNGTDTTVIPATWDTAIVLLATHYGLLALGRTEMDFNAADRYFQRYIAYVRSRKTDSEWMSKTPIAKVEVAWSEDDLTIQEG